METIDNSLSKEHDIKDKGFSLFFNIKKIFGISKLVHFSFPNTPLIFYTSFSVFLIVSHVKTLVTCSTERQVSSQN